MDSFVRALEKGEATHLMAVDPRLVKQGKIAFNDGQAKLIKNTEEDKRYEGKTQEPFKFPWEKKSTEPVTKARNSAYQVGYGGQEVQTGSQLKWGYVAPKVKAPAAKQQDAGFKFPWQ